MALGLVGKLTVMFGADFKGFDKAVKNATTKLNRFERNAKRLGTQLSTNLTLPILAVGAGAVKLASDFEESLNKVNVSFGESSKEVQAFAKTTLDNFGIAEGSALEMAALFGDMGTSIGLTDKEAASMSTTLVGLVGDLASFKNIRHDIAETALASVFTGETESLKKLGVIMTQANLQQFALEQGITKTIKQMTEAEKVQLRFNFVLARTTNAQGDYLNTIDGVANSTRNLQESVKELGAQFGTLLIPLTKELVKSLKGIVDTLRGLTDNQKEAIIFFAKVIAIVGPVITILGILAGAISSIIGLFASLSATTLAAILGSIGAAAKFVITKFGGFKQSKTDVDNLTGSVKELKDITDQLGGGKRKLIFDPSGVKPKKTDTSIVDPNIKETTKDVNELSLSFKELEKFKPLENMSPVSEQFAETMSMASEQMGIISMNLEDINPKLREANALSELFGDVMFNSMMRAANSQEGFFSSFVENMKKAIKQLLIQLAVMTAINFLLGGPKISGNLKAAFGAAKGSILGLASGGLVTGPTMALVGEGAGTNASNPEVVAPLDKLKGMINGGSGSQQIEVFGRISGNDIFISNQRGALGRLRTV
tara:strand:+ start:1230 stop:3023 length:1794 start_codon:yes stop_codon:yes gene_type:complete